MRKTGGEKTKTNHTDNIQIFCFHFCRFLKVYYYAKSKEDDYNESGRRPALEELFLESLPMSRYDMMDGDEIHIDVSNQPQQRFKVAKNFNTSGR